jgi:hypothetical protein
MCNIPPYSPHPAKLIQVTQKVLQPLLLPALYSPVVETAKAGWKLL